MGFERRSSDEVTVEKLQVSAYRIPTEHQPEHDGTFGWSHTTMVLVEVTGGGQTGLGYTYSAAATGTFIQEVLLDVVKGRDAMDIPGITRDLLRAVRNPGREGVGAMAISAVDTALWDLKARLLGQPLAKLLGMSRPAVRLYGSGGFTNLSDDALSEQLRAWTELGIAAVKIKVGRDMKDDARRVRFAREVVGPNVELFVDANGAWDVKHALRMAELFSGHDVRWYEEPVSSDDLEGLRRVRDRTPAKIEVTAGEYGWHPVYFRRMLEAGAVDVMMADATRCLGVSGFMAVAALCDAHAIPLSAHCAPALHLPACCSVPRLRHVEYFRDHERIERMLFDGAAQPKGGELSPDLSRPGLGLELKRKDAERYRV